MSSRSIADRTLWQTSLVLGVIAGSAVAVNAQTATTWIGGDGDWTNPLNWSSGVPNSNLSDASVVPPSFVNVNVNGSFTLGRLAVSNAALNLGMHTTMTIAAGAFPGSGNLVVNGFLNADQDANICISGPVTLSGGGQVGLNGGSSSNSFFAAHTGDRLTVNNTSVIGSGSIGEGSMSLTNNGSFVSNVDVGTMVFLPPVGGDVTNNGTLRAIDGGTIYFQSGGGSFTNNGLIEVYDASTFYMDPGINFTNNVAGTLTGGSYAVSSYTSAATLNLAGPPIINNAAAVYLAGEKASIPALAPLAHNLQGGQLHLTNGASFTTVAALSNAGRVEVGADSTLAVNGDYTQTAGTTFVNGYLSTQAPGDPSSTHGHVFIAGGLLEGYGSISASLVNNGGIVHPGAPALLGGVSLFVNGDYTQGAGGTLAVDIDGTQPFLDYGLLWVGMNASLDGALAVTLLDGFEPKLGDTFTVLTTSNGLVSGEFSTLSLPQFEGRFFEVTYTPGSVVLTVVPAPRSVAALTLPALLCWRRRRGS